MRSSNLLGLVVASIFRPTITPAMFVQHLIALADGRPELVDHLGGVLASRLADHHRERIGL